MIQTVTQNSALSQTQGAHPRDPGCTHAAHALRPNNGHNVVSWRTGRHVKALPGRVAGHVAARTGRVVGPPVTIQKSYRYSIPAARTTHRVACAAPCVAGFPGPCRRALGAISQPLGRCVATPGLPLLSRYNCSYCDTPR